MRPTRSFYYLAPALVRSPTVLPLRAALLTPTHSLIPTLLCVDASGRTQTAALRAFPRRTGRWRRMGPGACVVGLSGFGSARGGGVSDHCGLSGHRVLVAAISEARIRDREERRRGAVIGGFWQLLLYQWQLRCASMESQGGGVS